MNRDRLRRWPVTSAVCSVLPALGVLGLAVASREAHAGLFSRWACKKGCGPEGCAGAEGPPMDDVGGTWYWLRSPDEEKRVVAGLYNRYCIRCHGVDGRGIWDIPGIPDFTNVRWQAMRSDAQRARIILEGRGAVMPPFRGALSLCEAWAIGRYLRTFVPGTEVSRPDLGPMKGAASKAPTPPR